jgi:nicotinamide riboside kinase
LDKTVKNIIVTGPESTGKTELCQLLADHYKTIWIPEFARAYIENLQRPYTFEDVEIIAKQQFREISENYQNKAHDFVFFDTSLIITKVWFDVVYRTNPDYLERMLNSAPFDLFLLCYPDIEWQPDKVRENGGEMRLKLFRLYERELQTRKLPYFIVSGIGKQRLSNALIKIHEFFNFDNNII